MSVSVSLTLSLVLGFLFSHVGLSCPGSARGLCLVLLYLILFYLAIFLEACSFLKGNKGDGDLGREELGCGRVEGGEIEGCISERRVGGLLILHGSEILYFLCKECHKSHHLCLLSFLTAMIDRHTLLSCITVACEQ